MPICKGIAKKCMQCVRTRDSDTLQYDWFFSGGQSDVSYMRDIVNSNAVLEHNANLRETLSELFETCSGSGEVFWSPSPELVEGLKRIARIYSRYQSI